MKIACLLGLAVLSLAPAPGLASGLTVVSEGPYAPPRADQFIVRSTRVGADFRIVVQAPTGPLVTPGKRLPAIYALDAGYGVAGPIGGFMAWSANMAPAYVVSIGYPDGADGSRHHNDLLFRPATFEGRTTGGGGAAFQAFLAEELRPFLAARYPLDPKAAVLFGHSLSGLFTANVLAKAPESYAGYIIASPSLWADPEALGAIKAAAAKGGGRRVYVAVGGAEPANMLEGAQAISAALSAPGSGFKVETHVFAGQGHIAYFPALAHAAYAFVLPPPAPEKTARTAIAVTAESLAPLVGVYEIGDGRVIKVTQKEAHLYVEMTGSPGGEVLAESPRKFFAPIPGFDVTVTFEGPPDRPATAAVLSINGAVTRATRRAG